MSWRVSCSREPITPPATLTLAHPTGRTILPFCVVPNVKTLPFCHEAQVLDRAERSKLGTDCYVVVPCISCALSQIGKLSLPGTNLLWTRLLALIMCNKRPSWLRSVTCLLVWQSYFLLARFAGMSHEAESYNATLSRDVSCAGFCTYARDDPRARKDSAAVCTSHVPWAGF